MSKKKANICTLLLAIVWITILIGSWFIKGSDGTRACDIFIWMMAAYTMFDSLDKFNKWLMK